MSGLWLFLCFQYYFEYIFTRPSGKCGTGHDALARHLFETIVMVGLPTMAVFLNSLWTRLAQPMAQSPPLSWRTARVSLAVAAGAWLLLNLCLEYRAELEQALVHGRPSLF